jgi:hypothetical protein
LFSVRWACKGMHKNRKKNKQIIEVVSLIRILFIN